MEVAAGKIIDFDDNCIKILVPTKVVNLNSFIKKECEEVLVGFHDGRKISPEQQRKAWALLGEITAWQHGFKNKLTLDDTNFDLKREYASRTNSPFLIGDFSLADCDMTTAREYISFLIDFILENDVPTKIPLMQACDDIEYYVLACLLNKKCAICNKQAELHHFDAIGAGRDRTEIHQIGMRVISLCREHHTEAHTKGRGWLTDTLHLIPMPLTEKIGRVWGLTKKNLGLAK